MPADQYTLLPLLEPGASDATIQQVWDEYRTGNRYQYGARMRNRARFAYFAAIVLATQDEIFVLCNDCEEAVNVDETETYQDEPLCSSCQKDYYHCEDCGCTVHQDDPCYLDGLDRSVCDLCRYSYYWCENCETYSTDECEECSGSGCDCSAHALKFRFPANGAGTIAQDERMTLALPKGVISEAGVVAIAQAVTDSLPTADALKTAQAAYHASVDAYRAARWSDDEDPRAAGDAQLAARDAYWTAQNAHRVATSKIPAAIESIGHEWQGKRGNYPKRLSSALHKLGVKLAPETLSEVGNLARQYSDDQSEFHIEFTRDLNQSAGYFYHEDSCWWQSYENSRCALKNWGGLAMRTFTNEDDDHDDPSGRVFVFPLGADLKPTQNAETAHAYMVFNAYGALSGYSSARIIAHLAGMTYRKVAFGMAIPDGYVNSSAGYLVASPDTIKDAPATFSFGGDSHRVTQ